MKNKIDIFVASLPVTAFGATFVSFALTPNGLNFIPLTRLALTITLFAVAIFSIYLMKSLNRILKYKIAWCAHIILTGLFCYVVARFLLPSMPPSLFFIENLLLCLLIASFASAIIAYLWPKKSTA